MKSSREMISSIRITSDTIFVGMLQACLFRVTIITTMNTRLKSLERMVMQWFPMEIKEYTGSMSSENFSVTSSWGASIMFWKS